MKNTTILLLTAIALVPAPSSFAGNILLSHLDADFHASFDNCGSLCFEPWAAQNLIRTSVDWVRNGSTKPFLYVESDIAPPFAAYDGFGGIDGSKAFHARGERGIINSGYATGVDYEKHSAATLASALANLSAYSAIVVASDFGGILTGAELAILNANRAQIADFVGRQGGGIFAMVETNDGIGYFDPVTGLGDTRSFTDASHSMLKCCFGLLGNEQKYGFLPYAVESHSTYGLYDANATVTPFGASIGFREDFLNGNVSHAYFSPSPDWQVVSFDSMGRRATIAATYVVPEPSTWMMMVAGMAVVAAGLRRR